MEPPTVQLTMAIDRVIDGCITWVWYMLRFHYHAIALMTLLRTDLVLDYIFKNSKELVIKD